MIEQCTQHRDRGDRVIFCWTEDYRDRGDRVILFVGQRTTVTGGQAVIEQCTQHCDRGDRTIFCWTVENVTGGTGCD